MCAMYASFSSSISEGVDHEPSNMDIFQPANMDMFQPANVDISEPVSRSTAAATLQ